VTRFGELVLSPWRLMNSVEVMMEVQMVRLVAIITENMSWVNEIKAGPPELHQLPSRDQPGKAASRNRLRIG
jgi:hypothetical protein